MCYDKHKEVFKMKKMKTSLKTYTKPAVTRHGSIEEMTKGGSSGSFLDATFPVGTPFSDLTFS